MNVDDDSIGPIEEVYSVSESKLFETLNKKSSIYGNLLGLLTLKPGDLPSEISESIIRLSYFQRNVIDLSFNMLHSFIALPLMKRGYFDENSMDGFEEKDLIQWEKEFYFDLWSEPSPGSGGPEISTFVNKNNRSDRVKICLFKDLPDPLDNIYFYDSLSDSSIERLIAKMNVRSSNKKGEVVPSYFIVDPTIVHLFNKRVEEISQKIRERLPDWETPKAEEFVARYLSDGLQDYKDEFEIYRKDAMRKLEKNYPFIPMTAELSMISQSRKDIQHALHDSESPYINEQDIENILRTMMVGVEGLLQTLNRIALGREMGSRLNFSDLLSNIRGTILEDYGEDTLRDLEYLRDVRNSVSHPREIKLGIVDLIKAAAKSKMFLDLFDVRFRWKK